MTRTAVVAGAFDNLRSQDIRFLEEAAKIGPVVVWLWGDEAIERFSGAAPKFPEAERKYVLDAIRHVYRVGIVKNEIRPDSIPLLPTFSQASEICWVVPEWEDTPGKKRFSTANSLGFRAVRKQELQGFPAPSPVTQNSTRKKVIVTGCYDWLHSGHVRFFEEVSAYGDLYVVVGHDANIRLLKGAGHPLLPEDERRYLVGSVKHVKEALISSGEGWLDAEPEIARIKPDIYAVNEDGDKGGKREFCEKHGIEYLVLKRNPASGLPQRTSTELRGF